MSVDSTTILNTCQRALNNVFQYIGGDDVAFVVYRWTDYPLMTTLAQEFVTQLTQIGGRSLGFRPTIERCVTARNHRKVILLTLLLNDDGVDRVDDQQLPEGVLSRQLDPGLTYHQLIINAHYTHVAEVIGVVRRYLPTYITEHLNEIRRDRRPPLPSLTKDVSCVYLPDKEF